MLVPALSAGRAPSAMLEECLPAPCHAAHQHQGGNVGAHDSQVRSRP